MLYLKKRRDKIGGNELYEFIAIIGVVRNAQEPIFSRKMLLVSDSVDKKSAIGICKSANCVLRTLVIFPKTLVVFPQRAIIHKKVSKSKT